MKKGMHNNSLSKEKYLNHNTLLIDFLGSLEIYNFISKALYIFSSSKTQGIANFFFFSRYEHIIDIFHI